MPGDPKGTRPTVASGSSPTTAASSNPTTKGEEAKAEAAETRILPQQILMASRLEEPRMTAAQGRTSPTEDEPAIAKGKEESNKKSSADKGETAKEKRAEKEKEREGKAPLPQRLQQRQGGGAGGGGQAKPDQGPSTAERAETIKKFSEQFQMASEKSDPHKPGPQVPPPPGQPAQAPKREGRAEGNNPSPGQEGRENPPSASNTPKSEQSAARREPEAAKPEANRAERVPAREGQDKQPEDFSGLRRNAGQSSPRSEMEHRQAQPQSSNAAPSEKGEARHGTSSGEGDHRGGEQHQGEREQPREQSERRSQREESGQKQERGEREQGQGGRRQQQQQREEKRKEDPEGSRGESEQGAAAPSCPGCGARITSPGTCPRCDTR